MKGWSRSRTYLLHAALVLVALEVFNLSGENLAVAQTQNEDAGSGVEFNLLILELIPLVGGSIFGGLKLSARYQRRIEAMKISAEAEKEFIEKSKSIVAFQFKAAYSAIFKEEEHPDHTKYLETGEMPPDILEVVKARAAEQLHVELSSDRLTNNTRNKLKEGLDGLIARNLMAVQKEVEETASNLLTVCVPISVDAALLHMDLQELRKSHDPNYTEEIVELALNNLEILFDSKSLLFYRWTAEVMIKSELGKRLASPSNAQQH